jgi:hypothetical protein
VQYENANFGIIEKSSGTLHAFTCVAPKAGTVPTIEGFDGYYEMLNFIYDGLNDSSGGAGLAHLKKAFEL